jgi:DNA invertase Pin-like site-specific DNA recombinase
MAQGRFVAYYRVSTDKQGRSGLGLEAQREAVHRHLNGGSWQLVAEVIEVESGKRNDRPKLAEALRLCRIHKANLIIAKLDRLARNVAFISNLMESGVEFTAADFPQGNRLTVHILAAVAEHEAMMISQRTRAALASKRAFYARLTNEERIELRAKGKATQLGGNRGNLPAVAHKGAQASVARRSVEVASRVADLAPIMAEIRTSGATSLRQIAAALNARNIKTPRGHEWSAAQVKRTLDRVSQSPSAL